MPDMISEARHINIQLGERLMNEVLENEKGISVPSNQKRDLIVNITLDKDVREKLNELIAADAGDDVSDEGDEEKMDEPDEGDNGEVLPERIAIKAAGKK